ncbi:MAG TPA: GPW/gp25 family protein [Bryobacteraceae bacterium]|jgi:phage baseplate assembly protein W|nr:GPW/gp25 family protein [Bryobacteraceae bacterium]HTC88767.1 GPW/gp25 family protein [Bryobacteraceae bacterium]
MNGTDAKAFLGKGWSFPVRLDPGTGDIAIAAYEEDIRQAILIILRTALGERVMRPDFGAGLETLVFEAVNTTTMALTKHRVEQGLVTWEPRIDVNDVQVTTDPPMRNTLRIAIGYTVRATNTFYNLVFPFYLQEGQS